MSSDDEPNRPQSRQAFVPHKSGPTDFRTVLRHRLPWCGTGIALVGAMLFAGLWDASLEENDACPTVQARVGLTECQRALLDGPLEGRPWTALFAAGTLACLLAVVFIGLSLRRKRVAARV